MPSDVVKLLTDAGSVVILAIVVYLLARTISRSFFELSKIMQQYVAVVQESTRQTALIRESIEDANKRHMELLLGNNAIVHLTYDGVNGIPKLIKEQTEFLSAKLDGLAIKSDARYDELKRIIENANEPKEAKENVSNFYVDVSVD